ncbi:hypothetical protein NL676_003719 [Syzygium grande]|nr:hypothetical protein NL676_003719 [Syzygium grande]
MVVFTLAVSIVLILFGHRRKSSHNLKLRISIWSAYMTADSLVIVAIGIRSSALREALPSPSGSNISHGIYHLHGLDKVLSLIPQVSDSIGGDRQKAEGYIIAVNKLIEIKEPEGISSAMIDREHIVKAYDLLRMFRIVEIEVGFLYDLLHEGHGALHQVGTPPPLLHFLIHSIGAGALLFGQEVTLSRSDLSDTCCLLSLSSLRPIRFSSWFCSDWSNVWLCKGNKCCALRGGLVGALNFMRSIGGPRWSHSIAQFSLLSFCTKERPLVYQNVLESLRINEKLEKYHYTLHEDVSNDFRDCIFGHIKKELINMEEHLTPVPMDIHKSLTKLLKIYGLTQATWTVKGEFNQVVLTWHIVTEILYYSHSEQFKLRYSQESKLLPRYMVYLLVMYPSMLPCVIREIRLGDTSDDALKVLRGSLITRYSRALSHASFQNAARREN